MRISRLSFVLLLALFLGSCQKDIHNEPQYDAGANAKAAGEHGHLVQTKTFSDEVAEKWLDVQLRALWMPRGRNTYALNGNRYFAYFGIALYESVVPGMPAYRSLGGQLNGMPAMPETEPGMAYHWPTAANAALAHLSKSFFATSEVKSSIDSLETALNAEYSSQVSAETFARSVAFGTEVATRILAWAFTDGAANTCPPYQTSTDLTKWRNVDPNPTGVAQPCWGNNRLFVAGSTEGTYAPLPPPYSEDPSSPYYAMVKQVYDLSQTLTQAQKDLANYFADVPGYPSGTHYVSIFRQVLGLEELTLDQTAVAQAKVSIAMADAQISAWWQKYTLLQDRPVRYIRQVLGHTTWESFLPMPTHPEYPSGHSQTGGAFAAIMESIFGTHYAITLHTYDIKGLAPRSYDSFSDMVADIGMSRVYGGIHYVYTVTASAEQSARIAENILELVDFHKGEGKP